MSDAVFAPLEAELSAAQRVAVAYAPRSARGHWIALLAFDNRLARAALGATEPMLGQLRLAWWRDRFREPATAWPEGEPLLAALTAFDAERPALEALVDAWEALVGMDRDAGAMDRLAEARSGALFALARTLGGAGDESTLRALARRWTFAEHGGINVPAEPTAARFTPAMRPLAILAELSSRPAGLRRFLRIIRLGTLGR